MMLKDTNHNFFFTFDHICYGQVVIDCIEGEKSEYMIVLHMSIDLKRTEFIHYIC